MEMILSERPPIDPFCWIHIYIYIFNLNQIFLAIKFSILSKHRLDNHLDFQISICNKFRSLRLNNDILYQPDLQFDAYFENTGSSYSIKQRKTKPNIKKIPRPNECAIFYNEKSLKLGLKLHRNEFAFCRWRKMVGFSY